MSIHEIRYPCNYKILIFNEIELFNMNCVCCEDKVHEFELVLKWKQKAFLDFYFPFPFNQIDNVRKISSQNTPSIKTLQVSLKYTCLSVADGYPHSEYNFQFISICYRPIFHKAIIFSC